MNTTLRALAERIAAKSGNSEDQMAIELIKRDVLSFRQLLLKREYEKVRTFAPSLIMAFDLKLSEIVKNGSKAFISDVLPAPLLTTKREPFISVGNSLIDHTRKIYGYISPEQIEGIQYRRFSKIKDYYTYENHRIISFHKSLIRVRYVPENPLAVLQFTKDHDATYKCGKSLEQSCFIEDDLIIEESLSGAILTFFGGNSTRNVPVSDSAQREDT